MKKPKTVAQVLAKAAALMEAMAFHGIEGYTVICIHDAGKDPSTHDTPAQQYFRTLFPDSNLWQRLEDGSWDWDSRILALSLAAEMALEEGL